MTNPLQHLGIAMDNIARCVYRHLLGVRIPAASIRLADIKADRQFILTRLETACADVAYWRGELERTEEMIEPDQPWPRCAASAGWTTAAQAPAAPEPPTEQETDMETLPENRQPKHAAGDLVKIPRLAKSGKVIMTRLTDYGVIRVLVDIPEGLAIKRQWFDEDDLA